MEVDEQRREAALETRRRATRPAQGSAMALDGARSFPEFDTVDVWRPRDRVIIERMITYLARKRQNVFVEVEVLDTYIGVITKKSCACDCGRCFCRRVLLSSSFFFILSFFHLLLSPRFVP